MHFAINCIKFLKFMQQCDMGISGMLSAMASKMHVTALGSGNNENTVDLEICESGVRDQVFCVILAVVK